jgi:hypothetical protein
MSIFWSSDKKQEPRQARLPMTVGFANRDQRDDRFSQAWSYKPDNRELKRMWRRTMMANAFVWFAIGAAAVYLLWDMLS